MPLDRALREIKLHGSADFAFVMYDMEQDNNIFVTNHWHDEVEILYIMHGTLFVNINGIDYIGNKGDIFFINKGEIHEMYGKSADLKYYAFVFDIKILFFEREDFVQKNFLTPIDKGEVIFKNRLAKNEETRAIMEKIVLLNLKPGVAYMLKTKAELLQFMSVLFETGEYSNKEKSLHIETKSELKKDIVSYINENCSDRIMLSDIAKRFNMSPKYFCRFFKNNFGKTFIEYVNEVRIENAINMLSDKNTVTEAALTCGFSNMSYFTRTFKKITGRTPSEYQRIT